MSSIQRAPSERRALWISVLVRALPLALVIGVLSAYVAGGLVPNYCDENVYPGTDLGRGCEFLDDVGYTLIRVVPPALVVAFALLAAGTRRVGLVWLGFALALVVLVVSTISPNDYPF